MFLSKKLIVTLCVLSAHTGCIIPTYTGKATISQTHDVSSKIKVSKVLMIGAGSTASRLFLENLSEQIQETFNKNKILCDFSYVGKIPRGTHLYLNQYINPKYDGYLVFSPTDTAFVNTSKEVYSFFIPIEPGRSSASGSGYGSQYKEDYTVELFSSNDSLKKIWEGQLKLDFDFARSDKYQGISKQIFEQLNKKIVYQ